MTETGDARPWWRTSADDGADDPIARLLEEPGPEQPAPEARAAPEQEADHGGGRPAAAGSSRRARRPLSLVAVALLAGALAMVLVLIAALSAQERGGLADAHHVPRDRRAVRSRGSACRCGLRWR